MRADLARLAPLTISPLHAPTDRLNVRVVLVLDTPYRVHWVNGANERHRLNLPGQAVVVLPGLSGRV